ncbi:MAG: HugZ family protein [Puniceicoccales bacterium]
MSETMTDEFAAAEADYQKLLQECRSLILATAGESPTPEASYVPFVRDESGAFYVFVSEMARHTANLRTGKPASVMLIEDEATAKVIFARRRATFTCTPELVARDSEECNQLLAAMKERHGSTVSTLAGMQDFHMIRLKPTSGRVVLGFAAAYRAGGDTWNNLERRTAAGAQGHR